MQYYPERRVSKAAVWSRRLASFSVVLLLTAAAGHRLAMLETPGFFVVLGLAAGIAAAALLLAAVGYAQLWNNGDVAGRNVAAAVLLALVVLGPLGMALYWGLAAMATVMLAERRLALIITFAVLIAIAEWLRGHLLTGFPWSPVAQAAMPVPLAMQSVGVVGMIGMNALAVFVFAMPAVLAASRGRRAGLVLALALRA